MEASGFHACPTQWHVAKHDVYGKQFLDAWEASTNQEINQDNMLEIGAELDNLAIEDE